MRAPPTSGASTFLILLAADLNRQATASAPRDTAQEHWESAREAANSRRNSATEDDPDDPHPALRISRRTQAAILYALEEALRGPNQFSPDLAEENAQMSDLLGGNGRAANGGARSAAGPVPVQQAPATMRTPQQIMRARQERETARKQAEAEAAKEREEQGLTSYWIRRLEQNQEELAGQSLTQQMSRQITDLSAAGANLFHAVVELQRLRASSERKFQRWFYETRSEQERQQEGLGELRKAIEVERAAREEALEQLRGEKQKSMKANKMVQEMQRELSISKDEARRAWEELGRREQEERERVVSLREGQPTLVGGVQVRQAVATATNSLPT
ncbi:hypothetical protein UCDDS831_g03914 [Diplodia seriata]|uniref:Uncharacterized protein n=1 Tax=Diplodia seriata TaxID=420778 RepID=A0A0G2GEM5_9PEZI|nr:hypothetical protein UCDDS831_g03914 [Diplodia seriata]